jgi:hypothetical protein
METPSERYIDLAEFDMVTIRGLPLVTVIEMAGETQIYRIDKPEEYWDDLRDPFYVFSTIGDLKALCDKHGIPISEEEFSKARVFPTFIKSRIEGSYKEYRAMFG